MRQTESVQEYCTCGAKLVPDARFCHKCGRPLFDWRPPEEPAGEITPAPLAAPPPEINFHNRAAVRTGLLMAVVTSVLISLPMPMYVNLVWMLGWLTASGFLAVYFYQRRTGQQLSVRQGARMGWMAGVFCFAIATIFFTVTILAISSRGSLAEFYRDRLTAQGAPANLDVEQMLEMLERPAGLASLIFVSLLMMFLLLTLLPTLGGAIGAKVLERDS
jgi:hypothetical protein